MLHVFIRLFGAIALFSFFVFDVTAAGKKRERITTKESLVEVLNKGDVYEKKIEKLDLTQNLESKYFSHVCFNNCTLNLEFISVSFTETVFRKSIFNNVYFRASTIDSSVCFSGATFNNVYFVGCYLNGIDLGKINPESIIWIDEKTKVDGACLPENVALKIYIPGSESILDNAATKAYFEAKGMIFVKNAKRKTKSRGEFPKTLHQDLIAQEYIESNGDKFEGAPELEVDSEDETRVIETRSRRSFTSVLKNGCQIQ